MRILLKGYYGFGNLGDDILMIVSYKLLKEAYPTASIVVFSNNSVNNKDSKAPVGYNTYIKKLLNEDIEIIDWTYKGHFDLIFHGGGGIYFDQQKGNNNLLNLFINNLPIAIVTKIDHLLRRVLNKPARLSSIRRVGMGIGIGKHMPGSNKLYKHLSEIGSYDLLLVRDNHSTNFLLKHRFKNDKLQRNTDLAFLYNWNNTHQKVRDSVQNLGIIIKNNIPKQLLENVLQLAKNLMSESIYVTFYSLEAAYDQEGVKKLGIENITQYVPTRLEEFLSKLGNEDLLYTARAHGAIIGACLGIPSIILNTEIKLEEVANMLNHSSLLLDKWDIPSLEDAFEYVNKNYDTIQLGLQDDLEKQLETAKKLLKVLP